MRFTMVVCFSAVLVSVATGEARARGPECPLVKCGDGLKVACFVGKETCYCHCDVEVEESMDNQTKDGKGTVNVGRCVPLALRGWDFAYQAYKTLVKTDDPCESVEQEPCPEGHNECSAQDISCQCRCVPD